VNYWTASDQYTAELIMAMLTHTQTLSTGSEFGIPTLTPLINKSLFNTTKGPLNGTEYVS